MQRLLSGLAVLATCLALLAAPKPARADGTAYFLSATNSANDQALAERQCAFLQGALIVSHREPVHAECARLAFPDHPPASVGGAAPLAHLHSELRADGSVRLTIRNLAPEDETDFHSFYWTVERDPAPAAAGELTPTQKTSLQRLVQDYVVSRRSRRALRETLLVKGLPASARVGLDSDGNYIDKATGRVLSYEEAYRSFADESPKQKHYLTAAIEAVTVLGGGMIAYYNMYHAGDPDWVYNFDWKGFRAKLTLGEGIRFDNNAYGWNMIGHPFGGALDYLFARTNGLNPLESFLFAVTCFALWDYVVQFHSTVSINDAFFTPVAGMAVGEAMYQMSQFFARGDDTIANRVLSAIFGGGVSALNDWIHHNQPRQVPTDRFGFPADVWHQFHVFAGAGIRTSSGRGAEGVAETGFSTELINLPGYGRQGQVSRLIHDTAITEIQLRATLGEDGVLDFMYYTKVALAGYYRQSVERGVTGDLRGYSFFIGPSTAFRFDSEHGVGPTAVANVLGGSIDLNFYSHGFHVRASIDVFGDFAAVSSFALARYQQEGGSLAGTKSVLADHGYYYAFGITLAPSATVSYRGFEAGADLRYEYFASIEGYDQRQEAVTNDFHLTDRRLRAEAWLAYTLPGDWLKIALTLQRDFDGGSIGSLTDEQAETTVMGSMIFVF